MCFSGERTNTQVHTYKSARLAGVIIFCDYRQANICFTCTYNVTCKLGHANLVSDYSIVMTEGSPTGSLDVECHVQCSA